MAKLRNGAAPIVLGLALISGPAFAQAADPQATELPATAADTPTEDIVVTGSRIPQPNLEGVSPVTLVSSQDIKLQGTTKVEDLLNSLPSVFASQASTLANGSDGTASVDLRGLGTNRTLTLVNGRRLLPGDPSPTSGSAADINIIPASILKRVEVLTGGASSTYGADAVAGVVNFIVDTDFTGVRIDGQYSLYQHNNRDKFLSPLLDAKGFANPKGNVVDGGTVDATISIGSKFADDRGHALVYFGYRKANAITQNKRDYSACVLQNSGGGVPRCGGSLTNANGTVVLFDPNLNTASSTVYTFQPGGGFANTTSPYNFAPTNHYQRPDERYTAGLFANYEVSDAIKPYVEFMFMDDRTVAQIAPSGDFGNTLTVNCDNALMSAVQRNVICAAPNLINGYLGNFPLAQSAPYNTNPGAAPLVFTDSFGTTYNQGFMQLLRRNVEGGPRQSDLQHTNFRGVIGSKGDLDKNWSYDAYYQYGRSNYSQVYSNEFSVARLGRALNVVDDPRTPGFDPICRSVLDGSDPSCVPYNVFNGAGAASPASVAYLSATGFQKGQTSEQIASASLTGLLGDYGIKSPWASDGVAVNLGVEYRKESLELQTDNAFSTGDLTGQGGATLPISGSFHVFEVFGEAQVPLIHESFIHDLSLNLGYRHSSYETSADRKYDTDTFKIGVDFAPIRDIRFRGAYNRAARAPNIQELFATPTVGLNGSSDPCSGHAITATEYGCIAQGLTVGSGTAGNPAGQYNGLIGGNPDLKPEIATTKTFGIVFQPSFLRKFSLTVDWFDIKIKGAISPPAQDAILKDCGLNATATFTPISCSLINRDAAGSIWLTPGGYVDNIPNNQGSTQTRGIEVSSAWSTGIGNLGTLNLSMNGTYLDKYKVDNGITQPYDCAGLYGPTCSSGGTVNSGAPLPKWRHKARATFNFADGIGISLQWRYIGKVKAETLEHDNQSLGGATNFNPGLEIKSYSYFDLATSFNVDDKFTFRLGVNNLLDKQPPYVTSGNGGVDGTNLCPTGPCNGNTYPATYDALGRYLFAGVTLNF
ncbi:TonB-dependent receptor [Sphingomonas sp. So64.6b]|nr:TonB-dependent receptor [Sphingomonas sp. So64.6b]